MRVVRWLHELWLGWKHRRMGIVRTDYVPPSQRCNCYDKPHDQRDGTTECPQCGVAFR